ncbi:RND family transporter [Thermodesulfobacteriota bacterium]
MKRIAEFIIEKRYYHLTAILLISLFFGYHASNMKVQTVFSDLLPQNHKYINVHNEVRNVFGGANQVLVMVQVRDPEKGGKYKDIFNPDTLARVKFITDELRKFQAADRYKIMSIAHRKVRDMKMTSQGYVSKPLMWPDVPQTPEELEALRLMVYGNGMAYPGLVSLDSKSALIMVDFFEEKIDYATCFKEFQALRKQMEDENHIVAIAGEPMHLGYIDSYVGDVVKILIYTVLAMMIVFFLYFRSKRGMLLPIVAAGVSAVWGLGFLSMLGYNLDPLVLVFPFLIAAMAASHSTQVGKRYREEIDAGGDNKTVCKRVVQQLFKPGLGGILTDASGIIIIAITPISILQKITLSCAFWAFATVIIAMVLVPILLSCLPLQKPERYVSPAAKAVSLAIIAALCGAQYLWGIPYVDWLMIGLLAALIFITCFLGAGNNGHGVLDWVLLRTGAWLGRRGKYIVIAVSVLLFVWGCTFLNKITIGNAVPGSEILWPFHRYNVDSFRITFSMPLLNPLYIILDTGKSQGAAKAAATREVLQFARYMKQTPNRKVILVQTLQGRIPGIHAGMRERDPRWRFLPDDDRQTEFLFRSALQMGGPGSFDKFVDLGDRNINIVIFCRDKTAQTIKEVFSRVKHYIKHESSIEGTSMRYKLAGGAVGVQAGVNETLTEYQLITLGLALAVVFVFCSCMFRSVVAGIIILMPLLLSNVLAFAFMVLNNPPLPLTTATLPVSSVGIGLGVDYGIYLVSRIMEEYHKNGKDINAAVSASLGTTGKAIIYIATTLICGIIFWFLSMMMFQALMGLLLAIILTLNMLGALLVIPSFIMVFKPNFIEGHKP